MGGGEGCGGLVKAPNNPLPSPFWPSGTAQRSVRPETLTGRQLQEETLTSLRKEENKENKEEKDGASFHHHWAGIGLINFVP